ncbi:MAG: DNA-processing protein DprA [Nitrospinota bacterium]
MANLQTREAWIALNLVPGLSSTQVQSLRAAFGDPREVLQAGAEELQRRGGLGPKPAARLASFPWEDALERETQRAGSLGVSLLTVEDEGYPAPLREIFDPPPVLYVLGHLLPDERLSIAVVGTRRPTSYGRRMAKRIGRELADKGLTIVSGMARGIDTAAHQGALEAGGRTVAVAGCGLASVYPPEAAELQESIVEKGAVISEKPLEDPPLARHFPQRNRIICGLTLGTVVVEAAERSGALITARLAAEQGREVYAVPGPADSDRSKGTHRLIREGAALTETAEDVIAQLSPEWVARLRESAAREAAEPFLAGPEAKIFGLVAEEDKQIDRLIEESRLSPADVSGALMSLELKGLIRQYPGKVFARA